jgi:hypothetical protein
MCSIQKATQNPLKVPKLKGTVSGVGMSTINQPKRFVLFHYFALSGQ